MASPNDLNLPVRALIVGYPGSGKTTAIAALANAGFKIRYLLYDKLSNIQPLLKFTDPDKLGNIDVMHFEDSTFLGRSGFQEVAGIPEAFNNGLRAMIEWRYKQSDGSEVNLGSSKSWGPDTVVVLDSLTSMGEAAMRKVLKWMNKAGPRVPDTAYGPAMKEQMEFVKALVSSNNKHHTIVLAHLKMIGPREIRKGDHGDDEITQAIKRAEADLIPTRLWPRALGRELPQEVGKEFATIIEAANKTIAGGRVQKVLRTAPREELDLKVPDPSLPAELDNKDGLLKVFEALSPASVALVSGKGAPA